jgi:phage tail protein X
MVWFLGGTLFHYYGTAQSFRHLCLNIACFLADSFQVYTAGKRVILPGNIALEEALRNSNRICRKLQKNLVDLLAWKATRALSSAYWKKEEPNQANAKEKEWDFREDVRGHDISFSHYT